jgi:acetyl-CoA C-acetyltransferase
MSLPAPDPNTPVLVGVGQLLNRVEDLDQAIEPVEMMLRAGALAEADAGASGLLKQVQSVRVIRGLWRYQNPARLVAERIGAAGAQTVGTLFGGNQVQAVVNRSAASILAGELDLVLITGAENGFSHRRARKAGVRLPATDAPGEYDLVIGAQKPEHHENEIARGIRTAIQVYPMYENAIRHARGESVEAHRVRISELWSRFNDVAQTNPNAWIRENVTAEEIEAHELEHGGRHGRRADPLLRRPRAAARHPGAAVDLSARLRRGLRSLLGLGPRRLPLLARHPELAKTELDALSFVDLYSCFPSAVQIGARELGLPETAPLTVTGGLTFGGGPLNNYVMHSIARMAELLRERPGARGLITANGGNLYKHAHGVYSSAPPEASFQLQNVQAEIDALPARECLAEYRGEARIESYTVMYSPDAAPAMGHVACLTPDGARTWVNTDDPDLMQAMTREEFCGRKVRVDGPDGLRVRS